MDEKQSEFLLESINNLQRMVGCSPQLDFAFHHLQFRYGKLSSQETQLFPLLFSIFSQPPFASLTLLALITLCVQKETPQSNVDIAQRHINFHKMSCCITQISLLLIIEHLHSGPLDEAVTLANCFIHLLLRLCLLHLLSQYFESFSNWWSPSLSPDQLSPALLLAGVLAISQKDVLFTACLSELPQGVLTIPGLRQFERSLQSSISCLLLLLLGRLSVCAESISFYRVGLTHRREGIPIALIILINLHYP